MNRCFSVLSRLRAWPAQAVLGMCLAAMHAPALAQVSGLQPPPFEGTPNDHRMRPISRNADRGWMEFLSTREVVVDGQPLRMGGGYRIRDERNMMVALTRLIGERREVFYTFDNMGRVQDVWLMKDSERGRLSPKQKREQALRMQGLDPTQNPRNKRDNLRMLPFDELPRYQNSLP